ncbi:MAG: NAD(P)H-hydrate dehydratase [Rhizomicrobium sp.]
MHTEILTVAEIYAADHFTASHGTPPLELMENVGSAITRTLRTHYSPRRTVILCGPGNNGGDGFVIARQLDAAGWAVTLALLGEKTALKGDAASNAARWNGAIYPLSPTVLAGAELVIDALFGVGLARPLSGAAQETVQALNALTPRPAIVAVDIPSGIAGDSGKPLGDVFVRADRTVTFFRKKPAHVLMPGRLYCGQIEVADIGIPESAIGTIGPKPPLRENTPDMWLADLPRPDPLGYKYTRGHTLVVSGPAYATGAARMAARAALRVGAGLVSIASPTDAMAINAAHTTAIMLKSFDDPAGLAHILTDKRFNTAIIGPGCGLNETTRTLTAAVLASGAAAVLDADALSVFAADPATLFAGLHPNCVLTPHDGEFERLFPGLLDRCSKDGTGKLGAARQAAKIAGAVLLLKGPDTVIAAPEGSATICTNAPPTLATAGAGDVLAGFIGGLLAQQMPVFLAAAAGAWLHGAAAREFGPGLIAEDLPEILPAVLRRLYGDTL